MDKIAKNPRPGLTRRESLKSAAGLALLTPFAGGMEPVLAKSAPEPDLEAWLLDTARASLGDRDVEALRKTIGIKQ